METEKCPDVSANHHKTDTFDTYLENKHSKDLTQQDSLTFETSVSQQNTE